MPEAMPTAAANAQVQPAAQPEPKPGAAPQSEGQKQHHAQRQPRDDKQRFAGPPGEATAQPQQEQPAAPRRIKAIYRENNEEVVEELTEEELVESRRQLRAMKYREKVATERLQRAGELAKETEEARLVAKAIEDGDYSKLRDYYAKRGKQPVDVLAGLLEAALNERDMDPTERALAEREAKLAEREAAIQEETDRRESEAFEARVAEKRKMLHGVWGNLLEQSNLPKTEAMLETSARIFLESLEATQGQKPLSHEQVAELTRLEMFDATAKPLVNAMEPTQFLKNFSGEGSIVSKLDEGLAPEDLLKHMPKLAERFHRYLYQQARAQRRPGGAPQQRQQQAPQQKPASDEGAALDPWLKSRLANRSR
jgi:hypothetical protein